jgi:glycosyltransferase involved in cell wall biosynthesis
MPNVEFRPRREPGRLYEDSRVLLVPYADDNRPRVVLEAQACGIPVLAFDRPGLKEAVGPGGLLVAPTAGPQAWVEPFARLWDDGDEYDRLANAALQHSKRASVQLPRIAEEFEAAVGRRIRVATLSALADDSSQLT